MLYRNVKTGAEIKTESIISAPDWIAVGADAPKKEEPKTEAPKETKEEPKSVEKKAAPKKNVKRTKK